MPVVLLNSRIVGDPEVGQKRASRKREGRCGQIVAIRNAGAGPRVYSLNEAIV